MFAIRDQHWYWRRPISYRSYNPRVSRPEILKVQDQETNQVVNFLKQQNIDATNLGGLARGVRFWDLEVGRRHYNYHNYLVADEYFIHQWKETNDLAKEHPTGTHLVFKSFPEFFAKLKEVVGERGKKI